MTLKLINNKIVFTPNFPDVEASLLETYDTILRGEFIFYVILHFRRKKMKIISIIFFHLGSSEIPRFEYALDPDEDEKPKCLKPTILPDIVNKAKDNVRNIVANQKKGNIQYFSTLLDNFDFNTCDEAYPNV